MHPATCEKITRRLLLTWYPQPAVRTLPVFKKTRKILFLFNMTEGNSDSEAISLICSSFPELCSYLPLPEEINLQSSRGVTKRQAINYSWVGANFVSLDSSYNKLWTVHYVEINVRVTGSEWERQQVSGNVEIQKRRNLAASSFRLLDEVYVKHLSPSMHTQSWGKQHQSTPCCTMFTRHASSYQALWNTPDGNGEIRV